MVRAKVASIEFMQSGREVSREQYSEYIELARRYTQVQQPSLVITHGFSGSGKSTQVKRMLQNIEAVAIHSDIERKRLFGVKILDRDQLIYHAEASRMTYTRLAELAKVIVQAGFTVIVDATFLIQQGRNRFAELAKALGVTFRILDCQTPIEVCEERIRQRQQDNRDPSDATVEVLHRQVASAELLTTNEMRYVII